VPEPLALARDGGAKTLDFMQEDIYYRLGQRTGPDTCIDAVGTEPETCANWDSRVDKVKVAAFMGTDGPHVLRQAIQCCRNSGVVSIIAFNGD
jgi:threonine dehydrogenase-like Zn-dependent dehydrogenase